MKVALPPALPAMPRTLAAFVRVSWFGLLAAVVAVQLLGLGFSLRNAYHTQPVFFAFGLTSAIGYDGGTTVSPTSRANLAQHIARDSHIVAIDGHPLPPRAHAEAIAARLRAVPATAVVRFSDPRGRISDHRIRRSPPDRIDATGRNPIPLTARMALRLVFAAMSAVALIGSAVLLYRRRPEDSEAVLISFAFLLMAAVIDPPILMWMGLGLGAVIDWVTGLWWTLIVVAFAAFPSGRFEPGWLRWTIVAAPPLGLVLALDLQSELVSIAIGVLPPLVLLVAQFYRYRVVASEIERQQIKWAAFGFAAGFALLGLSLVLADVADQSGWSPLLSAAFTIGTVCLFSLAFAVMPLGLLVALLHHRLWEADTVIRRSANYAVLTLLVGFAFTLAADVTKAMITAVFGTGHVVVSTTLGAITAVAIFTPARTYVLRWSKERFDKALTRLQDLPQQLLAWRQSEDAQELGMRALAAIVDGSHAAYAALFVLTPTGRELVAVNNIFDAEALEALRAGQAGALSWPYVRPLQDDDGIVGTLMLGARSDGNPYNRAEWDALESVIAPFAEALRIARRRTRSDLLRDLEARLARLEGSGAPQPT